MVTDNSMTNIQSARKGVILAGGTGSRMRPITQCVNKHLLPVYDKPMIYYSLSTLILAGVSDIAIVCNGSEKSLFQSLLGDGTQLGVSIEYYEQPSASGIVHAIKCCLSHWIDEEFMLILGDNLFFGPGFSQILDNVWGDQYTWMFGYSVANPEQFGVIEFNSDGVPIFLHEKPRNPTSNSIVTGLYKFNKNLIKIIDSVGVSERDEYEIVDLLNICLQHDNTKINMLGRGFAWMDMGTIDDLKNASSLIASLQQAQGYIIGSPEEVAWRLGLVSTSDVISLAQKKGSYYDYLIKIVS